MVFQIFQLGIGHLAGRVFFHGFKDVLDRHVMALELSGHDRPAVQHQRRHVQAGERHHGSRNGLVAAGQGHDAVEEVSARHEFDRIGDHLTADQRGLHAFRPIEMPSETAIVLYSIGVPPAARMPAFTRSDKRRGESCRA